jgi:hypothetical protein
VWNASDIENLRPTDLFFAVDTPFVLRGGCFVGQPIAAQLASLEDGGLTRCQGQPPYRLLLQFIDAAKQRRTGRAHVTARGKLALRLQVIAELALRDLSKGFVELILGQ